MPDSGIQVDEVTETGSGTAVTAAPVKKPAVPKRRPKQLPPYKVLLHNDEVNTFEKVIAAILKLTTLEPQEALLRTLEAHETGVALLLVTHKERAELYHDQFTTFKITVTIEPDEA
jgi:ATP-dependent Clp protease adaptor protein ClpS